MFHKILVPLNQSPMSEHVFEEAVALAKVTNARLMLLHVLAPGDERFPTPIYSGHDGIYSGLHEVAARAYTEQWQAFEHEGLEWLRSLQKRAADAGVSAEFTQNVGEPGRVICAIAQTWGADLILMGRRGLSRLSELLFGSASNYVLHHAPCSVLAAQGRLGKPSKAAPEKVEQSVS